MKIDINSPVEILKITLPEKDYPACDVTLFNLSTGSVVGVEITLTLSDAQGKIIQRLLYRGRDISCACRKSFVLPVPVEENGAYASAEAVVEKVWYDSGNVWRRDKNSLIDIDVTPLPSSKALEELQAVAGNGAVVFPREEGNVWVCVCGRVNPSSAARCVRCLKDKKLVLTSFSRENVERQAKIRDEQLAEETKKAQAESAAQREKEEKQRKHRKKCRIIAISIAAVVLVAAALAVGYVKLGVPYVNYKAAEKLVDEGKLDEAAEAFAALGKYKDSAAKLSDVRFLKAKGIIESGDMSGLESAREVTFALIGDDNYPEAENLTNEADYLKAASIMQESPEEAEQIFLDLGDYRDSRQQSTACVFIRGKRLMAAGKYYEAKSLFDTISDYSSDGTTAAEMSSKCTYAMADAALSEGNIDEAIELFSSVSSYSDSGERLQQAYYTKAQAYQKEKKYAEAGEAYLSAGDYEDARSMAQGCFYLEGQKELAAGNYAKAETVLANVRDYEDGEEKWQEAAYKAAQKAMNDTEYTLALTYLEKLPEDYMSVQQMLSDCLYIPGKNAMDRGNYSGAVEYFSKLDGYKDSGELLKTSQLEYAKQLSADGRYEDAMALLEGRSDKLAVAEKKKISYAQGKWLMEKKQYSDAAAVFEALGKYEDSEKLLTEAQYEAACAFISAGDYISAEVLLENTTGYKDTDGKLKECSYLAAESLSEEGKSAEAAEMFMKAVPFSNSQERAAALYYAMAGEAANRQDIVTSARYFAMAGDYQDAPEQSSELFDAYYRDARSQVSDMIANGEYAKAVNAMDALDLTLVPEKYSDFRELWNDANYLAGESCLAAGDTETAIGYYMAAGDDQRAKKRLDSKELAIVGEWESRTGILFTFRADGTGVFGSDEGTYLISGNTIRINGNMEPAFRITAFAENSATIRDLRSGASKTLQLIRSKLRSEGSVREINIISTIEVNNPASSSVPVPTLAPLEDVEGFVVDE